MTESRIKTFLVYFYEQYILTCYNGFELAIENKELLKKIENYDIEGYFLKHLDIYVESGDAFKEYSMLYNNTLFAGSRDQNPEDFNQLELFLIENIQLFVHTILEEALKKTVERSDSLGVRLYFKPIDNKEVKLIDLVSCSEQKMKEEGLMPPSMG